MSFSEEIYIKIEQYLANEMTEKDRLSFEKEIANDAILAEEIEINKQLQQDFGETPSWVSLQVDKDETKELESFFESDEAAILQQVMLEAQEAYKDEKEVPVFSLRKIAPYAIAASIALFIGVFSLTRKDTAEGLYANYSGWKELPSLTSRAVDENKLLTQGEVYFLDKQYVEALKKFESYTTLEKNYVPVVSLYKGISYMEIGAYPKAMKEFDTLINSKLLDSSKGYWYKTLLLLKQGNKKKAIQVLHIITSNSDNYNYFEAQKILKELQ